MKSGVYPGRSGTTGLLPPTISENLDRGICEWVAGFNLRRRRLNVFARDETLLGVLEGVRTSVVIRREFTQLTGSALSCFWLPCFWRFLEIAEVIAERSRHSPSDASSSK